MNGETIRTVLERKIRERHQTFEEFAAFAETYAREHGEPGTLSVRHLQRLVIGTDTNGHPLSVRPATARLLQNIFGLSINELLSPPDEESAVQPLRAAIAIVRKESKLLLVRRREYAGGISWQFPAGVVKPGASPEAVAIQETLEETGVTCIVTKVLGSRLHPVTRVLCDYLLCDYISGEARNADIVENSDVLWIEGTDLPRLIPAEHVYPPILAALQAETAVTHRTGK